MALPEDQTAVLIATEALSLAGYKTPSASLITRARDEWLIRVLKRISKMENILLFEETKVAVLNPYQQRYALPDDCDRVTDVRAYSGEVIGISLAVTLSNITLSAADTMTADEARGKLLALTTGNSKGSLVRIVDFNTTTKLATISPNFTILPTAGDNYVIIDRENILNAMDGGVIEEVTTNGLPTEYTIYGKTPRKELILDTIIDNNTTAVAKIQYLVYVHKIDLTDARLTWVYNELHSELTQGVLAEALKDKDDSRYIQEYKIFLQQMNDYIQKETRENENGSIQIEIG